MSPLIECTVNVPVVDEATGSKPVLGIFTLSVVPKGSNDASSCHPEANAHYGR